MQGAVGPWPALQLETTDTQCVLPMLKPIAAFSVWALLGSPCLAADNCEPLRARIEANIASKGINGFALSTVDAQAEVAGQVVGQCANGTRKIVYVRSGDRSASPHAAPGARPAPARAPSRQEDILTECRDGRVFMGGRCKD